MKKRESIIQADTEYCYLCWKYLHRRTKAVDEHHAMHGTANRRLADEDLLKVYLCRQCHQLLHDKNFHDLDLQQEAERVWLSYYNKTIPDFIKRYGKNYLD